MRFWNRHDRSSWWITTPWTEGWGSQWGALWISGEPPGGRVSCDLCPQEKSGSALRWASPQGQSPTLQGCVRPEMEDKFKHLGSGPFLSISLPYVQHLNCCYNLLLMGKPTTLYISLRGVCVLGKVKWNGAQCYIVKQMMWFPSSRISKFSDREGKWEKPPQLRSSLATQRGKTMHPQFQPAYPSLCLLSPRVIHFLWEPVLSCLPLERRALTMKWGSLGLSFCICEMEIIIAAVIKR